MKTPRVGGTSRVVAADGDADVGLGLLAVVRRIERDPAALGVENVHPRVRRDLALPERVVEVAADVARRNPGTAAGGEHHVREVLADAAAERERRVGPRHHVGRARLVDEQASHRPHHLDRALGLRPLPSAVADSSRRGSENGAYSVGAEVVVDAGAARAREPSPRTPRAVLTSLSAVIEIRS